MKQIFLLLILRGKENGQGKRENDRKREREGESGSLNYSIKCYIPRACKSKRQETLIDRFLTYSTFDMLNLQSPLSSFESSRPSLPIFVFPIFLFPTRRHFLRAPPRSFAILLPILIHLYLRFSALFLLELSRDLIQLAASSRFVSLPRLFLPSPVVSSLNYQPFRS